MPQRSNERPKRPSTAGTRANAACRRACAAHDRITEMARQVSEDIDQITVPGVPVEITAEDSIVTSVENLLAHHKSA